MRSIRRRRCALGVVAVAASIVLTEPSEAGGISGSGSLTLSAGTAQLAHTGSTFQFGNTSPATQIGNPSAAAGPSSTGSSGTSGSPWAPTSGSNVPNTPLNLSGSSEGSGSEGGSGGGLVWGEPLSADVATFGKVHTNLRYFSQSSSNGTQQAVGINFTLRY